MTSPSRRVALWVVFSLVVAQLVGFYNSESAKSLSSHLIICRFIHESSRDVTALSSFFQGVTGVTGANPSYLSGRRQGTKSAFYNE